MLGQKTTINTPVKPIHDTLGILTTTEQNTAISLQEGAMTWRDLEKTGNGYSLDFGSFNVWFTRVKNKWCYHLEYKWYNSHWSNDFPENLGACMQMVGNIILSRFDSTPIETQDTTTEQMKPMNQYPALSKIGKFPGSTDANGRKVLYASSQDRLIGHPQALYYDSALWALCTDQQGSIQLYLDNTDEYSIVEIEPGPRLTAEQQARCYCEDLKQGGAEAILIPNYRGEHTMPEQKITIDCPKDLMQAVNSLPVEKRQVLANVLDYELNVAGNTVSSYEADTTEEAIQAFIDSKGKELISISIADWMFHDLIFSRDDFLLLGPATDKRRMVLKLMAQQEGFSAEAAGFLAETHLKDEVSAGNYDNQPYWQHWNEYATIEELAVAVDVFPEDKTGITIDDIRDESGLECHKINTTCFMVNTNS